jgi:hypothetical protein
VADESESQSAEIGIPIRTTWPKEDISKTPTIYANQLLITHAGPEFFLVFGVVTPVLVGPDEQLDVTELGPLTVTPVAKIAVSPETMATMAEAIQNNVESYKKIKAIRDKEIWHVE